MQPPGSADPRLVAPSAARNREPILRSLRLLLPADGTVLEVASGTGEHVAYFAEQMPKLQWQPTDPDAKRRASIDAWTLGLGNVLPALTLNVLDGPWPPGTVDLVLCINMIHIAPPPATKGLIEGAAGVLGPGGTLVLYGPFRRTGQAMAAGNASFDADLRERDPAWGLRVLEEVAGLAKDAGFGPPEIEDMPANNLLVVFRR